ncbi:hypothetical protein [Fictibacillus barbaricus]|uniref:Uncharacterized protein n=1 Tax=Fictibacillus barbaricus TaxID=182136 RepID=A0ABS2Z8B7_9BACL|nr:hypothetical protein [Fictibacillus barbaricus]MBN3543856.1 hypothetical protein [Fictibacillus barbaricus]
MVQKPFLSFLISITVGLAEGDGFAAAGMIMLLLSSFLIIDLITLLAGIFASCNSVEKG